MRAHVGLSAAAALLGCSRPDAPTPPPIDVNVAAARAQDDIANYAAARHPGGRRAAARH